MATDRDRIRVPGSRLQLEGEPLGTNSLTVEAAASTSPPGLLRRSRTTARALARPVSRPPWNAVVDGVELVDPDVEDSGTDLRGANRG